MATSVIEICNKALAHLRQRPIASLDDRTPEASQCKQFYGSAVEETLRAADWAFARMLAPAAVVADATAFPGYAYAFAYPANCAALRGFAKSNRADPDVKYTTANTPVGRVIYTNHINPVLIYTIDNPQVADFDAGFCNALEYYLAAKIAIALTGKANLMQGMEQRARAATALAVSDNYNEEPQELEESVPDWLAVRGVQNTTREGRAAYAGYGYQPAGLYALPGSVQANPQPAMITQLPPQILPPYVPGLTAPPEEPQPILGSDDFTVEAVGGKLNADGSVTIDKD